MEGWIKLHRKILEWEWFDDDKTFKLFIFLIISANIEDKKWHGINIKRGQLLTSVESIRQGMRGKRKKSNISPMQVRVALNHLKVTNEVTIETSTQYTIITINNYNEYQEVTKHITNEQQTSNKRVTTTKEYKNEKNNNNKEFETFLEAFNKEAGGRNYTVLSSRLKLFLQRRKNFPAEKLIIATKNMFSRDFYSGVNDRNWVATPEYLLRSDEQVDKFLNVESRKEKGVDALWSTLK